MASGMFRSAAGATASKAAALPLHGVGRRITRTRRQMRRGSHLQQVEATGLFERSRCNARQSWPQQAIRDDGGDQQHAAGHDELPVQRPDHEMPQRPGCTHSKPSADQWRMRAAQDADDHINDKESEHDGERHLRARGEAADTPRATRTTATASRSPGR